MMIRIVTTDMEFPSFGCPWELPRRTVAKPPIGPTTGCFEGVRPAQCGVAGRSDLGFTDIPGCASASFLDQQLPTLQERTASNGPADEDEAIVELISEVRLEVCAAQSARLVAGRSPTRSRNGSSATKRTTRSGKPQAKASSKSPVATVADTAKDGAKTAGGAVKDAAKGAKVPAMLAGAGIVGSRRRDRRREPRLTQAGARRRDAAQEHLEGGHQEPRGGVAQRRPLR